MEKIIEGLLEDFEHGKMSRRQLIRNLTLATTSAAGIVPLAAAAEKIAPKAISVNHISFQAEDHAKEAAFYSDMLGVPVVDDKPGISSIIKVGETTLIFQNLGVRNKGQGVEKGNDKPGIDHIAYTIANWDTDKEIENHTAAELKRRGIPATFGQRPGKSTHYTVVDPIGLGLEVGGKTIL